MFEVSTNGGGQCQGNPDTCKMPSPGGPVPTPYPNMAMLAQASGGTCAQKVKVCNKQVVHKGSEIPMSSGDEAGSIGGVVSNKIKGEVKFKKSSSKVKVEGQPVVYNTCMAGMNGSNANVPAGTQTSPSQTKVKVSS